LNWPTVQSWGYSIVIGKRTKDDFLLVDSGGRCWRLADLTLQERLSGLRRLLFTVARVWRSPVVPVQPVLEPASCSFEDVKREVLSQIERDDDVLTQFVDPDKLKQAVQSSQSAVELIDTLKRMRAVEFQRLDENHA